MTRKEMILLADMQDIAYDFYVFGERALERPELLKAEVVSVLFRQLKRRFEKLNDRVDKMPR